jgi:hypothetical protein
MDRIIVYPGAIPLDTDELSTNRNAMKALGMLISAVLGTNTVTSGLAVTQNSPAAMNVVVGPGSIFQLSTVDATAYGSLPLDTSDPLMKQGINIASTTLAISAPGTSGQSQNYLIEAALLEADGTPVVLPYYNASNPSSPYLGPGNSGSAQNTVRAQTVQLQAKAGVPATTGTQTTPGVDAGWVPLAVVTVAYGASSITSGNISVAAGAPTIPYALPSLAPGFSNQVAFSSSGTWTVPNGVTRCRVRVWGAGGGGGGSNGTNGGGGGGGGGYAESVVTGLTAGASHTITVGTAGTAGNSSGGNGGSGGTSSFDSSVVASGGGGGTGGAGSAPYPGGTPGSGSAGTIQMGGGHGNGGGSPCVPTGGGAAMGGGGGGASTGGGIPGSFPGGGGAGYGEITAAAGYVGAGGLVIVEY